MRRTNTIHIRIIKDLKEVDFKSLYRFFRDTPYQDHKGYGFVLTDIEDSLLSSTLVQKKTSYNTIFDTTSQTFKQQEVLSYENIPLILDNYHHTLGVFSNASNVNRVVAIISNFLNHQVTISNFPVSPYTALNRIKEAGFFPILQRVIIDNFAAIPGSNGRYNAEISVNDSGYQLMEKQKKDVRQISFLLDLKIEDRIEVTFHRNGGWKLRCDEDHTVEIIDILLALLLQRESHG